MKKIICSLIALCCLSSIPSFAAGRDGNQLYEWIKSLHRYEDRRSNGGDEINAANLFGFVGGILDYGILAGRFCPPSNTSLIQVISIVEKSLNEAPETRNLSGAFLVDQAISHSFPCLK